MTHPGATPTLVVVGELNPDIVVQGVRSSALTFGQAEDVVTRTTVTLGSSAAITAAAAAGAGTGLRAVLVSVVGDDDLGRLCSAWAAALGIDVSGVRVSPTVRTGSSVILVDADDPSDRHALTDLGAMSALLAADVTDAIVDAAHHLHISSFFLHTAAREDLPPRLARARRGGATTSLDTNPDPAGTWASGAPQALAHSDIFFANTTELLGLAGRPTVAQALEHLLATMPAGDDPRFPAVVHKEGADGATAHTRTGSWSVPAPHVEVVDTIGAGDTLAGTALAHLLTHADWPTALQHGVAAASKSTTAVGGTGASSPRTTRGPT